MKNHHFTVSHHVEQVLLKSSIAEETFQTVLVVCALEKPGYTVKLDDRVKEIE
jgi:hypothetical protein